MVLMTVALNAQLIESRSYQGNKPGMILNGEAKPMKNIKMELISLAPGKKSKKIKSPDGEYLIIQKEGISLVQSDQVNSNLTPRSIALITKNDTFRIANKSNQSITYYLIHYIAKDKSSGSDTAQSFVRLWEDLTFQSHGKGGVRNYFNQRTSQTKRFEMHVTTLNAGLMSHDPHTHDAEEIVLIIDGNTEMQIGEKMYKADSGDFYFLGSMVLHGIKNIGNKPSVYFAFQW